MKNVTKPQEQNQDQGHDQGNQGHSRSQGVHKLFLLLTSRLTPYPYTGLCTIPHNGANAPPFSARLGAHLNAFAYWRNRT